MILYQLPNYHWVSSNTDWNRVKFPFILFFFFVFFLFTRHDKWYFTDAATGFGSRDYYCVRMCFFIVKAFSALRFWQIFSTKRGDSIVRAIFVVVSLSSSHQQSDDIRSRLICGARKIFSNFRFLQYKCLSFLLNFDDAAQPM